MVGLERVLRKPVLQLGIREEVEDQSLERAVRGRRDGLCSDRACHVPLFCRSRPAPADLGTTRGRRQADSLTCEPAKPAYVCPSTNARNQSSVTRLLLSRHSRIRSSRRESGSETISIRSF